jgi:hypothetical protein
MAVEVAVIVMRASSAMTRRVLPTHCGGDGFPPHTCTDQSAPVATQLKGIAVSPCLHLHVLMLKLSDFVLDHLHFGDLAVDYITPFCQ